MNLIANLLTPQEKYLHEIIAKPFELSVLRKALDSKLKVCKTYEVFVPLVYHRCLQYLKDKEMETTLKPEGYFISNKGNVVVVKKGKIKEVSVGKSDEGYLRFWVNLGNSTGTFLPLHRALACNFVMPVDTVSGIHPKDLQVNHKNGDKEDFELENLEWCTHKENVEHAHLNGLAKNPSGASSCRTKPVKGTVLKGDYVGHEFILVGAKEIKANGFSQTNVNACCLENREKHYGCKFTYATEEEVKHLSHGISDEIKESLLKLLRKSRKPPIQE